MNETTPPKLIPPLHNRFARGMLPTEHTKLATAMSGPTQAFSINCNQPGPPLRKSAFQPPGGTRTDRKPAIRNPTAISFQSICQSITNALAIRVHR